MNHGRRPLAVVLLCLAACAPSYGSTYDKAYATAERAESAGRLAEALQAYDHAAAVAKRRGDADQARWAAADVLVREDRIGDAVARLDAMALDPTSDRQAEAAYRAADLRIAHGDTNTRLDDEFLTLHGDIPAEPSQEALRDTHRFSPI